LRLTGTSCPLKITASFNYAPPKVDLEQAERRAICERQPTDRRPEASGAAPGESFAENDRRF
jgi:hypothetical protein